MKLQSARSISGRLTSLVLFVSGIALLLAYLSFLAYDFLSLRHNLIESLQTQASVISMSSESALLFDDPQSARSTLAALRGAPSILAVQILQADGEVFASYARPGLGTQFTVPKLSVGQTLWIGDGTVALAYPITSNGKLIGSVSILAETQQEINRAKKFGLISAGILLLCFVIALSATSRMRQVLITPLKNLSETAQIVSRKKDYSVRAEVPARRDELASLVQSFNEMLDEIEKGRTVLEQKVAERTAELSTANRELEAFSYTVAHDLRGPLQEISNIAFILQSDSSEAAPDQKMWLDKLVPATNRMASLIDDLLNLSRAGSAPIQQVPIDLSALAKSILENLAQGSERKVEIVVAENCTAPADRGLIAVVLENLLRNAWKYTSRRESARIEFGCRTEGEEAVFFVRDNGAGFDPAYADRLFRPFQRLHAEVDFPGTGVGLATVQRIIARHGGRVWAAGSVDRGAEFSFTLPRQGSGTVGK
jgi:signal transduction histidine kinase